MTPDRWAAMQTAANQQDAHDWITVLGWAAVITAAIFLALAAVAGVVRLAMFARWRWCQWQEVRSDRLWTGSEGRTWR